MAGPDDPELEDGVEVLFGPNEADRLLRAGDYWQIPARVATGDVVWPTGADSLPLPQRPGGVKRHFAPLAIIDTTAITAPVVSDLRSAFASLAKPVEPRMLVDTLARLHDDRLMAARDSPVS